MRSERPRISTADAFVNGAPVVPNVGRQAPADAPDPHAPPTRVFKLRLNDYQFELLRELSKAQYGSMHATALRLLVPAMERKLGRTREGK